MGSRRTHHFLLTLRSKKVREETEKDARTMFMGTAKSHKDEGSKKGTSRCKGICWSLTGFSKEHSSVGGRGRWEAELS